MAKAKTGGKKMPATEPVARMKHARIELPEADYERLRRAAERDYISISAYIRRAVMQRIERDESKGGPK